MAAAFGVRQAEMDDALTGFAREARPWAFILFREACQTPEQVRRLCDGLRSAAGADTMIFIDQEGGRVARLKPPVWPVWPACAAYGALFKKDRDKGLRAAWLGHRLIATTLREIGVDGDFAPVLDRPVKSADPIVGDRAFSDDAMEIASLGAAAVQGLTDGAVTPCIKHMPGHGRAEADSHLALPRVTATAEELEQDLFPFRALRDAPAAMTAHIVYEAWDRDRPATCSPYVIKNVIRGQVGFDGLLMSDDLDMHALRFAMNGGLAERAAAAFAAGCDIVLQCSGKSEDWQDTAKSCPGLAGLSLVRARAAQLTAALAPAAFDSAEGWREFAALMKEAA